MAVLTGLTGNEHRPRASNRFMLPVPSVPFRVLVDRCPHRADSGAADSRRSLQRLKWQKRHARIEEFRGAREHEHAKHATNQQNVLLRRKVPADEKGAT